MSVAFVDVPRAFPASTTIACHFVYTSGYQPTQGAWVGVLKVGWRTVTTYCCFEWSSVAAYGKDNVKVILFQARSLPNDADKDQYQFVYVDGKGQVLGSSDPFVFSHSGDSMSSFEYVSSSTESAPLQAGRNQDGDEDEGEKSSSVGNELTPLMHVKGAENSDDVSKAERETEVKHGSMEKEAPILNGEAEDPEAQEFCETKILEMMVIVPQGTPSQVVGVDPPEAEECIQDGDEEKSSGEFVEEVEGASKTEFIDMEREVVSVSALPQQQICKEQAQSESTQSTHLTEDHPLQEPGCCVTHSDLAGSNQENGNKECLDQQEDSVNWRTPVDKLTDGVAASTNNPTIKSDQDTTLEVTEFLKKAIELTEENSLLTHRNSSLENLVKEFINVAAPLDKSTAALQSMWKSENQAYTRVCEKLKEKTEEVADALARVKVLEDKLNIEVKSKEVLETKLARCQEALHECQLQLQVIQKNLMRVEKETKGLRIDLKAEQTKTRDLEKQLVKKEEEYNTLLRHVGKLEVRCETLNEQIHVKDKQTEILFGQPGDYSQQTSNSITLSGISDVCVACPPSLQEGAEEYPLGQLDVPSDGRAKTEQHYGTSSSRKHKKHNSQKDRRRDKRKRDPTLLQVVPVTSLQQGSNPSRCFACGVIFPDEATVDDRRIHFEAHYEDEQELS